MVEGRQVEQIEAGGRLFLCGTDISINTGGALWDAAFVLVKYLEKVGLIIRSKKSIKIDKNSNSTGIGLLLESE